jgi:hypothetical protein
MTIARGETLLASDILNMTFMPKGAILMFSSTAWANPPTSDFKTYWHICDGQEGTLNLIDKFIRGGATSGVVGGTDVAQVPKHSHTFTGNKATGEFGRISTDGNNSQGVMFTHANGVFSRDDYRNNQGITDWDGTGALGSKNIYFSMTPSGAISEEGSATADNRPVFCTIIFIQKIK